MEEENTSQSFLQWRVDRLNEKIQDLTQLLRDTIEGHGHEIDSREDKIRALREELQASKNIIQKQKDQFRMYRIKNEQLDFEVTRLKNVSRIEQEKLQKTIDELEEKVKTDQKAFSKTLQQQEKLEKVKVSHLKNEWDKEVKEVKHNRSEDLRMQKKTMQTIIDREMSNASALQERLTETELENKKTVETMGKEMAEKVEENAHLREQLELEECKVVQLNNSFANRTKDMAEKIIELERDIIDYKAKVAKRNDTIKEKEQTIKHKEWEIISLRKGKNAVVEEMMEDKKKSALLTEMKKLVEEERDELQEEVESLNLVLADTRKKLDNTKRVNGLIIEELKKRRDYARSLLPERERMRDETFKNKILLLRLREDVQSCMNDVENPRKLRQKVLDLQKHIIEEDERTTENRGMCQKAVEHHKEKLRQATESCLKTRVSQSRERFHLEAQVNKAHMNVSSVRNHYIKLINKYIVTEHQLRQELKDVKEKLHKATKPASQKVKSWVSKKVLRSTPAPRQETVEEPVLYKEDEMPLNPPHVSHFPPAQGYHITGVNPVRRVVESLPPVDI